MKENDLIERLAEVRTRKDALSELYHNSKYNKNLKTRLRKTGLPTQLIEEEYSNGLIVLVKKSIKGLNIKEGALSYYLSQIVKNLVLSRINKTKRESLFIQFMDYEVGFDNTVISRNNELSSFLDLAVNNLKEKCKNILQLWASGLPAEDIAIRLNYKNGNVIRKEKSICMKNLIAIVDANDQLKAKLKSFL